MIGTSLTCLQWGHDTLTAWRCCFLHSEWTLRMDHPPHENDSCMMTVACSRSSTPSASGQIYCKGTPPGEKVWASSASHLAYRDTACVGKKAAIQYVLLVLAHRRRPQHKGVHGAFELLYSTVVLSVLHQKRTSPSAA